MGVTHQEHDGDSRALAFAGLLRRARLDRTLVLPMPGAPRTVQEGALAQVALARLVGAPVPAGFKIGATGRRMQEYLGLSGPAAGFMEAGNVYRGSADLRFASFIKPGGECEVAVRLSRDLPFKAYALEDVADAVGEVIAVPKRRKSLHIENTAAKAGTHGPGQSLERYRCASARHGTARPGHPERYHLGSEGTGCSSRRLLREQNRRRRFRWPGRAVP